MKVSSAPLDVDALRGLAREPEPWDPGEAHFWDDPHISSQMLEAHLDPTTGAASARPEVIEASVQWIVGELGLEGGHRLIDLGCGPGLYAQRFARRGLQVTGVDLSARSIEYAREHDPGTTYRCESYLDLADEAAYEAATLIYGDFGTFDDARRETLLANVHRALVSGGWFVLDVSGAAHHAAHNCGDGWSVHPDGGFWKPGPHLALMRHFTYPDLDLAVDQYVVVEPGGTVTVYRNWYKLFDPDSITAELEAGGFAVRQLAGDLTGVALDPESGWIGVIAQRV